MKSVHDGEPPVTPLLVGRGVDTLVLNVYYRDGRHKPCKRDLPLALKEQLDAWKQAAMVAEEPIAVPLTFQGVNLHMYPNGAGKGQWRWLLRCDNFNFLVSMGRLNCVAQVRFSSEFLWSCRCVDDAIVRIEEFLCAFFGECLYLQVSEVHLCADIAGWDVQAIDPRRDVVSRSRKRGTYEVTDLQVEDFSFGLNRSGFLFSRGGPISCVIYDKTREIRQASQKWWFHDLWTHHGWDEETMPVVWRVEFRFRREVLHEVSLPGHFSGIEDAYNLTEQIEFLWAYATGHLNGGDDGLPDGWLRVVVPGTDSNRSRWPTHPVWQAVQGAFLALDDEGDDQGNVIRERKRQANLQRATAAAVGYLSSMAAWLGRDGSQGNDGELSYMIHWLRERTPVYLGASSRRFGLEVAKKRVRFEQQGMFERVAFDQSKAVGGKS